jgi:hypothetical protein
MKKFYTLALAGIGSLNVFATPYQWVDSDQDVRSLSQYGQVISDTLDIRYADSDSYIEKAGFQPGTDFLSSATVGFKFVGYSGAVDWTAGLNWKIFASGAPFTSTITVNGVPVLFSLTGPLNDNGYLDYSLTYLGEGSTSLSLTKAWLSANGEDNIYVEPSFSNFTEFTQDVPEGGGTLLLLGSTALGFAMVSRRKTATL